jgi:hypothetical protein
MRIVEAVKEYVAKRDSFLLGGSAMQVRARGHGQVLACAY